MSIESRIDNVKGQLGINDVKGQLEMIINNVKLEFNQLV